MSFFNAVKAHPPATAFLPQRFWEHAVETVREVRAKDLTVPQRLFVASLTPHSTALPLRSPEDKWSDKLRAQDQIAARPLPAQVPGRTWGDRSPAPGPRCARVRSANPATTFVGATSDAPLTCPTTFWSASSRSTWRGAWPT